MSVGAHVVGTTDASLRCVDQVADACGAYDLGRVIASSGAGTVFDARRRRDGRRVAIKMFEAAPVSENRFRAYMLHEVYALNLGANPLLVEIIEFGETPAGAPYLVLEWIEGPTLAEILAMEQPMPVERALRLFGGLLDAVERLHSRDVVHADLSPDNIMVTPVSDDDVTVRLIDLGAARSGGVHIGMVHERFSTRGYDAPEVIAGEVPSRTSDAYAAGVILYELLAGVTPFVGMTVADVYLDQTTRLPPLLPDRRGGVFEGIGEVLVRMLDPVPQRRFPDLAAVRLAVGSALTNEGQTQELMRRRPTAGNGPHARARDRRHLSSVP